MAQYSKYDTKFLSGGDELSLYTKKENDTLYLSHRLNDTELGVTTVSNDTITTSDNTFDKFRIINRGPVAERYSSDLLVFYTCYGTIVGYEYISDEGISGIYYYEICEHPIA